MLHTCYWHCSRVCCTVRGTHERTWPSYGRLVVRVDETRNMQHFLWEVLMQSGHSEGRDGRERTLFNRNTRQWTVRVNSAVCWGVMCCFHLYVRCSAASNKTAVWTSAYRISRCVGTARPAHCLRTVLLRGSYFRHRRSIWTHQDVPAAAGSRQHTSTFVLNTPCYEMSQLTFNNTSLLLGIFKNSF